MKKALIKIWRKWTRIGESAKVEILMLLKHRILVLILKVFSKTMLIEQRNLKESKKNWR